MFFILITVYPGLAELNSLTQTTFIGDGRDRIFAVKKDALSIQKKKKKNRSRQEKA